MTPDECVALVKEAWPGQEWTDEIATSVVSDPLYFTCNSLYGHKPRPLLLQLRDAQRAWAELAQREDGAMYAAERAAVTAASLPCQFRKQNTTAEQQET